MDENHYYLYADCFPHLFVEHNNKNDEDSPHVNIDNFST